VTADVTALFGPASEPPARCLRDKCRDRYTGSLCPNPTRPGRSLCDPCHAHLAGLTDTDPRPTYSQILTATRWGNGIVLGAAIDWDTQATTGEVPA
jgi:hypothetical protein